MGMPGFGDYERFPVISAADPRYSPEIDPDHRDEVAGEIVDAWMKNPDKVGEYGACLLCEEYQDIERAIAKQDAAEVLAAHTRALRRAMEADAAKAAVQVIRAQRRQNELDAGEARAMDAFY